MKTYYCHPCAVHLGHLSNVFTSDPLQSTYQLDKFAKHTLLASDASVFNSTSTGPYGDYIVNAGASGVVEFDEKNRRNIILLAGKPTGFDYRVGQLIGPVNGVKVVLSSDDKLVHAFPVSVTGLTTTRCARCYGLIST